MIFLQSQIAAIFGRSVYNDIYERVLEYTCMHAYIYRIYLYLSRKFTWSEKNMLKINVKK